MKTSYKIIKDYEVNKYLEDGWKLYGNPVSTVTNKYKGFYSEQYIEEQLIEFYQAVIKEVHEHPEKPLVNPSIDIVDRPLW